VNNIHEKDWAEEGWHCHSGMRSNPYEDDAPPENGARAPTPPPPPETAADYMPPQQI
jgi:hypothetical protein